MMLQAAMHRGHTGRPCADRRTFPATPAETWGPTGLEAARVTRIGAALPGYADCQSRT